MGSVLVKAGIVVIPASHESEARLVGSVGRWMSWD